MLPGESDTVKEFIDNADKALYIAKSGGRNRISVYAK
jgi:PleD family two-component response regulator